MNVGIRKKGKVGGKSVECVFVGYGDDRIGYRFLIVKWEVGEMDVGRIMECGDGRLFERFLGMKDRDSGWKEGCEIIGS